MTSSTARSRHVRSTLAVLATALAMLLGVLVVLEGLATYAETRLGAYLWKEQDYLRVLSPSYHAGRGAGRLFIYGPSEAREGLLPEELATSVPGVRPYQNAQSIGTLEDGLVVLNYLEAAYGRAAVPDEILLGISTRFIADIRLQPSPLIDGIRKYSPHFDVVADTHPPRLVPRSAWESARARARLLALQPDRYRRALVAVSGPVIGPFAPGFAALERRAVRPAKYLNGKWASEVATRRWLREPGNFWEAVHAWDPSRDRDRVSQELRLLLDYVSRHGIRLYVVNLPELSWNRDLYLPGRYEAYLSIVTDALADTPFLDLRTFLRDEEFFDDAHPTWSGGVRLSTEVGAFVRRHRERTVVARGHS